MTLRRRLGAALVALLLATSACDIEVKESAHDLRDERIVGDLTFELDLSDPPSADELEVDPDAQYDIYTAPESSRSSRRSRCSTTPRSRSRSST